MTWSPISPITDGLIFIDCVINLLPNMMSILTIMVILLIGDWNNLALRKVFKLYTIVLLLMLYIK